MDIIPIDILNAIQVYLGHHPGLVWASTGLRRALLVAKVYVMESIVNYITS
jgi:hypothetical protein